MTTDELVAKYRKKIMELLYAPEETDYSLDDCLREIIQEALADRGHSRKKVRVIELDRLKEFVERFRDGEPGGSELGGVKWATYVLNKILAEIERLEKNTIPGTCNGPIQANDGRKEPK